MKTCSYIVRRASSIPGYLILRIVEGGNYSICVLCAHTYTNTHTNISVTNLFSYPFIHILSLNITKLTDHIHIYIGTGAYLHAL